MKTEYYKAAVKLADGKEKEKEYIITYDDSKYKTVEEAVNVFTEHVIENEAKQSEWNIIEAQYRAKEKAYQEWQATAEKGILNKEMYDEDKHSHLKPQK